MLFRKKIFENFTLPENSNEEWRYSPINIFNELKIEQTSALEYIDQIDKFPTDPSIYEICFVNGFYAQKYSRFNDLEVFPLNSSQNLFGKWFEVLNLAFFENGVSIHIKKDQIIEKPIVIRHYFNTQAKSCMASPHVLIKANEGSEANITEIFEDGSGAEYFINDVISFKLSKNSRINYLRLVDESKNSVHLGHINTTLEQDAKFDSIVVGRGARLSRHEQKVLLKQKNAQAYLKGIAILNDDRFEQNIEIIHEAPQTISMQDFKFILNKKSRGVFQGGVKIKSGAQQSSAQQINKNLLLDKKAHMDTKPQLDVYADDVKATHGATVGQLNEEEKFYLQSRGLSLEDSSRMLCEGFVYSTASKVKDTWQKNRLFSWLKAHL